MKNSIKIIVLFAVSLIIGAAIIISVLNVIDVYTVQEAVEYFKMASYSIGIIAIGSVLISLVTSLFKK